MDIIIRVTDVNERPLSLNLFGLNPIPENTPAGTDLATLIVDDPDNETKGTYSCSLLGADQHPFKMQYRSGEDNFVLTVENDTALNFEAIGRYDLTVQCWEGDFDIETVSCANYNPIRMLWMLRIFTPVN